MTTATINATHALHEAQEAMYNLCTIADLLAPHDDGRDWGEVDRINLARLLRLIGSAMMEPLGQMDEYLSAPQQRRR